MTAIGEAGLDDGQLMFAFAHDARSYLRTALTRIQIVQSSSAGAALPEAERMSLEEAANAVGDMNRLLSAMVAYCEAPQVAEKAEHTSLPLLLRGVVTEMKPTLDAANAAFTMDLAYDGTVSSVLRTVFKELISNACRFRSNERRGAIAISARREGDECTLTVSDNGLGVEQEWTERIFEPFQRMHSRSSFPGFGLGLATCNRIVDALGGTIRAQPREGGGLCVTVRIPLS